MGCGYERAAYRDGGHARGSGPLRGFETAIEEIGQRLVQRGHRVTVYCREMGDGARPARHLGMDLVHLPALRKGPLRR